MAVNFVLVTHFRTEEGGKHVENQTTAELSLFEPSFLANHR